MNEKIFDCHVQDHTPCRTQNIFCFHFFYILLSRASLANNFEFSFRAFMTIFPLQISIFDSKRFIRLHENVSSLSNCNIYFFLVFLMADVARYIHSLWCWLLGDSNETKAPKFESHRIVGAREQRSKNCAACLFKMAIVRHVLRSCKLHLNNLLIFWIPEISTFSIGTRRKTFLHGNKNVRKKIIKSDKISEINSSIVQYWSSSMMKNR